MANNPVANLFRVPELKEKILFGSDYPVISPQKWIEEFDKLPIKPEVRPLIMKGNAARLLGLA